MAFRVHIDAFHGDRPRNEAAFDVLRSLLEHELAVTLPPNDGIDWRSARGGNNQVCSISTTGGLERADFQRDAKWAVAVARAWMRALAPHRDVRLEKMVDS